MKPVLALLVATHSLAVLAASAASPAAPATQQFAWQQAFTAPNPADSGPFYRVELPATVYSGSRRRDLGDLRVFNAAGDALPYALLRQEDRPAATAPAAETPLALFPLPAGSDHENSVSLQVQQAPDGRISALRLDQSAKPTRGSTRYLLDASHFSEPIGSIRLAWKAQDNAVLSVTIDSSDDLQRWQRIATGVQLYQLTFDNQHLQQDRLPLGGIHARYLRLMADTAGSALEMTNAFVTPQPDTGRRPEIRWSAVIVARPGAQAGEYTFASPGLPIRRLRLLLPNTNTLAPVRLFHRASPQAPWQEESRSIAYRLQQNGQEVSSPDLAVGNGQDVEWRVVVDTARGGIGAGALAVQIGWTPHTLVFLAREPAPYRLAYGNTAVTSASLDVASLVPGITPTGLDALPTLGVVDTATPNATTSLATTTTGSDLHWPLWALLILGVVVLGAMVWKLLAQLNSAPDRNTSP